MKKSIITFVAGAVLFGGVGVYAGQYIATENAFPIQLNGENVSMEGYNIDGSTYFKLRDISNTIGGFDVDFNNKTIQLAKVGYIYDNSDTDSAYEDVILKNYARENIWSITNYDYYNTYTDVKFLVTDVTGDDKNDLLVVGMNDDGDIAQLEVYIINNGNVEKIMNEHCLGYHGGSVFPISYNNKIYICDSSYSSSTGFKKKLLKYENGQWDIAYSCNIAYNHETGETKYNVNNSFVSEDEYKSFDTLIENSKLQVGDFLDREML